MGGSWKRLNTVKDDMLEGGLGDWETTLKTISVDVKVNIIARYFTFQQCVLLFNTMEAKLSVISSFRGNCVPSAAISKSILILCKHLGCLLDCFPFSLNLMR